MEKEWRQNVGCGDRAGGEDRRSTGRLGQPGSFEKATVSTVARHCCAVQEVSGVVTDVMRKPVHYDGGCAMFSMILVSA